MAVATAILNAAMIAIVMKNSFAFIALVDGVNYTRISR
jgi:hypothetical protein